MNRGLRVRILTEGTYPDGMAGTYRIHCYATGLLEQGAHAEVVCARLRKPVSGKKYFFRSSYEGVPYTAVRNARPAMSRLGRYMWQILAPILSTLHCLWTARNFDVCLIYRIGLLPQLILVSTLPLLRKKLVFELNEYPYATEGNRLTRIHWVNRFLKWTTFRLVFARADGFIVISENLREVLYEKTSRSVKTIKIPILLKLWGPRPLSQGTAAKGDPYLFHAGSLSKQKDGIVAVFKAFALAQNKLQEESIRMNFVLTNFKTHQWIKDEIGAVVENHGIQDQIIVTGYLSDDSLRTYLAEAAVLLVNKPQSVQNKYNFPTKLGDYLQSGTPVVLAAREIEAVNYLQNEKNALVVEPDNIEEMAGAIYQLVKDHGLAERIGRNGVELAKSTFDYKVHSKSLHAFLEDLS